MTAPRNDDTLIRAFLAEGTAELPDRAFDAVRGEIHRTRQRVVIGPWRQPNMQSLIRVGLAAGVVAAIGLAWVGFGPRDLGPGGPSPSPAPTATAMPVVPDAALPPGRYRFQWSQANGVDGEAGPSISITIPSAGWTSFAQFAADKNYGPGDAGAGPSFVVWKIVGTYADPCTHVAEETPRPGPGIDELLEALADQPGLAAGPLTPVTIDGYAGKFVELTVTKDIATCPTGFYPWLGKYVQGNNERLRVYALDVDGFRLTFFLRIPARTTAGDEALLQSIVDSIDIEPLT